MRFQIKQLGQMMSLLREAYEEQKLGELDEGKVLRSLRHEVDNPKTLILTNKSVSAVLVLQVVPSHFATKDVLQATEFFSRTPGAGFRLLKEAKPWIDRWGNAIVKRVFFSTGSDETNDMLKRYGMKQFGIMLDMAGE